MDANFLIKSIQRILKRLRESKRRCRSIAITSRKQCTRNAVPLTPYCWQHESRILVGIAIIVGCISFIWTQFLKDRVAPSAELRELRSMRAEAQRNPQLRLTLASAAHPDQTIEIHSRTNSLMPTPVIVVPMRKSQASVVLSFGLENLSSIPAENVQVGVYLRDAGVDIRSADPQWLTADVLYRGGSKSRNARHLTLRDTLLEGTSAVLPDIQIFPGTNYLRPFSLGVTLRTKQTSISPFPLGLFFYVATNAVAPFLIPGNRPTERGQAVDISVTNLPFILEAQAAEFRRRYGN